MWRPSHSVGACLGLAHSLAEGAARLTAAVTDPAFGGGRFYGSRARTLTGPLVDQATIFGDPARPTKGTALRSQAP